MHQKRGRGGDPYDARPSSDRRWEHDQYDNRSGVPKDWDSRNTNANNYRDERDTRTDLREAMHTQQYGDRNYQQHQRPDYNNDRTRNNNWNDKREPKPKFEHWDRDPEYNRDQQWEKRDFRPGPPRSSISDEPTKSLVLRGLDQYTTEETIADFIKISGPVQEVRVIRNKQTGESRRFAFVEFFSIEDATRFLTVNNSAIYVDGAHITMDFTFDKKSKPQMLHEAFKKHDWICPVCNYKNFGWRSSCLNCKKERGDDAIMCQSATGGGQSHILLVRGMREGTTKETVIKSFTGFQRPLQDVRFLLDPTGRPKPTCVVEFYNVIDAIAVWNVSSDLKIDGQGVTVTFTDPNREFGDETPSFGEPQAPTAPEPAYHQQQQAAMQQAYYSQPPQFPPPQFAIPPIVDLAFDASSGYYYDRNTGYYFDNTTALFYDGNSKTYHQFDSDLNMFIPMTANELASYKQKRNLTTPAPPTPEVPKPAPKKTVVISSAAPAVAPPAPAPQKKKQVVAASAPTLITEEPKKQAPVVSSSPAAVVTGKLAKDVDRWKQSQQQLKVEPEATETISTPSLTLTPKKDKPSNTSNTMLPPPIGLPTKKNTTEQTHETPLQQEDITMNDATEETPIEEEPVLDFDTLMGPITTGNVCVLCQRKFENQEKLERHVTLSDLHKTNLKKKTAEINLKIQQQQQSQPKPNQIQKRKAPAQQTQKNKTQRTEQKSSPHQSQQQQQQQTPPLFDPFQMNNAAQGAPEWQTGAAAKMMALMGWKGGGLGAKGTGIVEPVKVVQQQEGAGLGNNKPQTTSEEDAEQAFKQMMKERRWGKS